jgi:hypothetical protein
MQEAHLLEGGSSLVLGWELTCSKVLYTVSMHKKQAGSSPALRRELTCFK